jgi:hypothetical protein
MGERHEPQPPAKLFFAMMAGDPALLEECERDLAALYGPSDLRGDVFSFDPFTDYYAREFGTGLVKRIVSVEPLISAEELVDVKIRTNEMEWDFAARVGEMAPAQGRGGAEQPRRVVNIDPGYLNLSKVVLASTKDHWHRLYVGRGIFEEITLSYRRREGGFCQMQWTYPDYKAPERIVFFHRLRERYQAQLARP